jgi:hypothetical protein
MSVDSPLKAHTLLQASTDLSGCGPKVRRLIEDDEERDGDYEEELEFWLRLAWLYAERWLSQVKSAVLALAETLLRRCQMERADVVVLLAEHGCVLKRQIEPEWADTPEGHMLPVEFRANEPEAEDGFESNPPE